MTSRQRAAVGGTGIGPSGAREMPSETTLVRYWAVKTRSLALVGTEVARAETQ